MPKQFVDAPFQIYEFNLHYGFVVSIVPELYIFICNGRVGSSSGSSTVGERLLSTLLTEMDGLEQANVNYMPVTP